MSSVIDQQIVGAAPSTLSQQLPDQADEHLARFLYMPTFDISLRNQPQSAYLGNWPNEMIPKRRLLKIENTIAFAINELPAQITSNEADFQTAYLPSPDVADQRTSSKMWNRTPRFVANTLLREYEKVGLIHFDGMNGREDDVNKLFNIILPADAIEVTVRTREGEDFLGPFLDELRDYVLRQSPQNLKKARLDGDLRENGRVMLNQLQQGIGRAWSHQLFVLNRTENLIRQRRNGGEGKEWYDQRDERFADSLPPQDLLFMADLNRQPLDMKELEAAKTMTDGATQAVVEGVKEGIREVVNVLQPQQAQPSQADIDAAVERALAAREKKEKKATRQQPAPSDVPVAEVIEDEKSN